MIQRCRGFMQKKNMRRGSLSIEFVFLIPLFLFMAIVIWQVAVAGMAVLQTQSALQDAMRVVSVTGDEGEAKEEALNTFGNNNKNYRLTQFNVSISGNRAIANATTTIDVLFIPKQKFTYNGNSEAPVVYD